ncbi:helix-turn-helix domain-containing protein [Frankia sp. ACN1ag]|uniref:helix-turn-helix domain-containing protein n=1 Tax=Frankia sp. ACN1ag TaxID=102891 RepID=UPI0037BE6468
MTRREYDLTAYLALRPRRMLERKHLLKQVWGTQYQDPSTVTEHIRRIRRHLAPLEVISTARGLGYRWDLPVETASR